MGECGQDRWSQKGSRPIRIGNCSGGKTDPGYQLYRQATRGDVDFITGDYLAEVNIAENAQAMAEGKHDGWEPSAYEGIEMTLAVLAEKRIKVVINGGAQNPKGLAEKIQKLVIARGVDLSVGYVYGDNLVDFVREQLAKGDSSLQHLDSLNEEVLLADGSLDLLDTENRPIVSANAYLGARAIVKGLELGADILICGRVADASPVIGVAWWWHSWTDTSYDQLASSLIAGHLLECSGYTTGANFSGFNEYPMKTFVDLPFPVAEIAADGGTIITKPAESSNGIVNIDTCTSQFLYELQGSIYLNSDVTADIKDIKIEQAGKHRVSISNIRGLPPPPTTKLAIFYHGGYEAQFLSNATGYSTSEKWELFEAQIRFFLDLRGATNKFQVLEFQTLGTPAKDPQTQFSSTTYNRIFAQAESKADLMFLLRAAQDAGQQHFSGFHCSFDLRTAIPRSYLAYYPALISQKRLNHGVIILHGNGEVQADKNVGHPPKYLEMSRRDNYETEQPVDLFSLGKTRSVRLGDIVQARSGDKGANINLGLFVRRPDHYPWLQTFMSRECLRGLMGKDWRDTYFIERCEFPNIFAVHFVIYGPLGRGVSSCRLLDCLGKGFADFIRDRVVDVPERFLDDVAGIKKERLLWL